MISYTILPNNVKISLFLKSSFDLVAVKHILNSLVEDLNRFNLFLPVMVTQRENCIFYFVSNFRSASGYSGLTMSGLDLFMKKLVSDYRKRLEPYFLSFGVRFITLDVKDISETHSLLTYILITPVCLIMEDASSLLSLIRERIFSFIDPSVKLSNSSYNAIYDGERKMFVVNVVVPKDFDSEALRKHLETLI